MWNQAAGGGHGKTMDLTVLLADSARVLHLQCEGHRLCWMALGQVL